MDTQILIEKIVKAINFAFRSDGTSPGLTVSWITTSVGSMYYASIVRWVNGEKVVVVSCKDADLKTTLLGVSKKFIEETPPPVNPIDELSDLLNEKKA